MLECCLSMSVLSALLLGFVIGVCVKRCDDKRITDKFPQPPQVASAV